MASSRKASSRAAKSAGAEGGADEASLSLQRFEVERSLSVLRDSSVVEVLRNALRDGAPAIATLCDTSEGLRLTIDEAASGQKDAKKLPPSEDAGTGGWAALRADIKASKDALRALCQTLGEAGLRTVGAISDRSPAVYLICPEGRLGAVASALLAAGHAVSPAVEAFGRWAPGITPPRIVPSALTSSASAGESKGLCPDFAGVWVAEGAGDAGSPARLRIVSRGGLFVEATFDGDGAPRAAAGLLAPITDDRALATGSLKALARRRVLLDSEPPHPSAGGGTRVRLPADSSVLEDDAPGGTGLRWVPLSAERGAAVWSAELVSEEVAEGSKAPSRRRSGLWLVCGSQSLMVLGLARGEGLLGSTACSSSKQLKAICGEREVEEELQTCFEVCSGSAESGQRARIRTSRCLWAANSHGGVGTLLCGAEPGEEGSRLTRTSPSTRVALLAGDTLTQTATVAGASRAPPKRVWRVCEAGDFKPVVDAGEESPPAAPAAVPAAALAPAPAPAAAPVPAKTEAKKPPEPAAKGGDADSNSGSMSDDGEDPDAVNSSASASEDDDAGKKKKRKARDAGAAAKAAAPEAAAAEVEATAKKQKDSAKEKGSKAAQKDRRGREASVSDDGSDKNDEDEGDDDASSESQDRQRGKRKRGGGGGGRDEGAKRARRGRNGGKDGKRCRRERRGARRRNEGGDKARRKRRRRSGSRGSSGGASDRDRDRNRGGGRGGRRRGKRPGRRKDGSRSRSRSRDRKQRSKSRSRSRSSSGSSASERKRPETPASKAAKAPAPAAEAAPAASAAASPAAKATKAPGAAPAAKAATTTAVAGAASRSRSPPPRKRSDAASPRPAKTDAAAGADLSLPDLNLGADAVEAGLPAVADLIGGELSEVSLLASTCTGASHRDRGASAAERERERERRSPATRGGSASAPRSAPVAESRGRSPPASAHGSGAASARVSQSTRAVAFNVGDRNKTRVTGFGSAAPAAVTASSTGAEDAAPPPAEPAPPPPAATLTGLLGAPQDCVKAAVSAVAERDAERRKQEEEFSQKFALEAARREEEALQKQAELARAARAKELEAERARAVAKAKEEAAAAAAAVAASVAAAAAAAAPPVPAPVLGLGGGIAPVLAPGLTSALGAPIAPVIAPVLATGPAGTSVAVGGVPAAGATGPGEVASLLARCPHLSEAAMSTLLALPPQRSLQVLQDVVANASKLPDPSSYVLQMAATLAAAGGVGAADASAALPLQVPGVAGAGLLPQLPKAGAGPAGDQAGAVGADTQNLLAMVPDLEDSAQSALLELSPKDAVQILRELVAGRQMVPTIDATSFILNAARQRRSLAADPAAGGASVVAPRIEGDFGSWGGGGGGDGKMGPGKGDPAFWGKGGKKGDFGGKYGPKGDFGGKYGPKGYGGKCGPGKGYEGGFQKGFDGGYGKGPKGYGKGYDGGFKGFDGGFDGGKGCDKGFGGGPGFDGGMCGPKGFEGKGCDGGFGAAGCMGKGLDGANGDGCSAGAPVAPAPMSEEQREQARVAIRSQLDGIQGLSDSARHAMLEVPPEEGLAMLERLRARADTIRNPSSYLFRSAQNYMQKQGGSLQAVPPGGGVPGAGASVVQPRFGAGAAIPPPSVVEPVGLL
eukprot:TRINITY_DN3328_c3_g1_i2.p1 TRINITY_DN3328_c3_g1~~TRINITY_DN3328_c3_g1_i2.p1  ORF type:complete len:1646 (-),score=415.12 TRINITY_DN3328_c3_g1_i2:29-4900(-)